MPVQCEIFDQNDRSMITTRGARQNLGQPLPSVPEATPADATLETGIRFDAGGLKDFAMLKQQLTLESILQHELRAVARGTLLRNEGDESRVRFFVAEGWLAASKSVRDGGRHIQDFILPGDTHDPTAADGRTSFVQIEALCDARIAVVDMTSWERLLHDHPGQRQTQRQRDIAARARQSERMLRLGKSSAETRVAYALIELCLRMGADATPRDQPFHLPLGQQQLGDFVGLSTVHVCRTLRILREAGMVTTANHMDIAIHDLFRAGRSGRGGCGRAAGRNHSGRGLTPRVAPAPRFGNTQVREGAALSSGLVSPSRFRVVVATFQCPVSRAEMRCGNPHTRVRRAPLPPQRARRSCPSATCGAWKGVPAEPAPRLHPSPASRDFAVYHQNERAINTHQCGRGAAGVWSPSVTNRP